MPAPKDPTKYEEWKRKISENSPKDRPYMFKENKIGKRGVHQWVIRWKGKPNKCEVCGTEKASRFEWSNIDHKYRQVLDDYIRMCPSCHRKYDYKYIKKYARIKN